MRGWLNLVLFHSTGLRRSSCLLPCFSYIILCRSEPSYSDTSLRTNGFRKRYASPRDPAEGERVSDSLREVIRQEIVAALRAADQRPDPPTSSSDEGGKLPQL